MIFILLEGLKKIYVIVSPLKANMCDAWHTLPSCRNIADKCVDGGHFGPREQGKRRFLTCGHFVSVWLVSKRCKLAVFSKA